MSDSQAEHEHRVTPLELFFDLVFVFAFTQVSTLMADDPTWGGLGNGLPVLAALWWAWVGYAWLTNAVDPDEGVVRGAMQVAIVAMYIAALAVPEAAVYLLTFAAIRIRTTRRLSRGRFVTAAVFVLLFPLVTSVPALVALALASAVWVSLHAYEFIWWREARAEARALRAPAHS